MPEELELKTTASATVVEYVHLTEDGKLRKKLIQEGEGDLITVFQFITTGYLWVNGAKGTKFDSRLGCGEKAELLCEPDYAYGAEGNPPTIPANSTLLFEVEVVSSKPVCISSSSTQISIHSISKQLEDPVSKRIVDATDRKFSGNGSFAAGKYAEAANAYRFGISRIQSTWGALLEEVKEINQLKLNLNSNLAASLLKTKDLKEAIEACEKALEVDVKNVKALLRMGQAHIGLSSFDKAEKVLKQALEIAPKDAAIL
ncbi:UNVERIFIED_CONTAM: cytochrome P450 monooxygenase 9 [Siphonaria sp. JEL0065]|nr:cytochrome P450 monooxygenase 9 [Siphonaria sp. JEL0065]